MLNSTINRGTSDLDATFCKVTVTDVVFAVPAYFPQDNIALKMLFVERISARSKIQFSIIGYLQ